MSESSSGAVAVSAEHLFDERHDFWGGFYRFVWGMAALAALMLILMAIFLV